jgi:hypothetical protein
VSQEPGRIQLSQAAYADKLLDRLSMSDCNPTATPMEARLKLRKKGNGRQ